MILQVGVKVLLRNHEGEYLFLKRSPIFNPNEGQRLDIPGGRIESDESLTDALTREVEEETGLILKPAITLLAAQDIFIYEKDLHVVRLTYEGFAKGDVKLSDEHSDFGWKTARDALEQADEYLADVLKELS